MMKKICVFVFIVVMLVCGCGKNEKETSKNMYVADLSEPVSKDGVTEWDCIYFGNYHYQNNALGGAVTIPIKWRVLSVDKNIAYLVSDKTMGPCIFGESGSYKKSYIRNWLNGYEDCKNDNLINKIFTDEERDAIKETSLNGSKTLDKLGLLSEKDLTEYGFESTAEGRIAGNIESCSAVYWWVRKEDDKSDTTVMVHLDGEVGDVNVSAANEEIMLEVRPTLSLDLSKDKLWSKADSVYSSYGIDNPNKENNMITWDCIYFGKYPQEDATGNENESIKWRVLSLDGTRAVLLADQILDGMNYYYTGYSGITWEQSSLRSWLNGYGSDEHKDDKDYEEDNFIDKAFSEKEKNAILITSVYPVDNRVYGTEAGGYTYDKVYILNSVQLVGYFGLETKDKKGINYYSNEYPSIMTANTPYAETKVGVITNSDTKKNNWWLRSPGIYEHYAEYVSVSGRIHDNGAVADSLGIRPVVEIDISEKNVWSYAGKVSSDGNVEQP